MGARRAAREKPPLGGGQGRRCGDAVPSEQGGANEKSSFTRKFYVGLAAVVEDLGWRRISNWTSGGALAAGLIVNGVQKGWMGALHSLIGAAIGFGVFLIFYLLGGMGGGDVKLMAGFGALLGDRQIILRAALWAALSRALIAVGFLAVRWVIRRSRAWLGNAPQPA